MAVCQVVILSLVFFNVTVLSGGIQWNLAQTFTWKGFQAKRSKVKVTVDHVLFCGGGVHFDDVALTFTYSLINFSFVFCLFCLLLLSCIDLQLWCLWWITVVLQCYRRLDIPMEQNLTLRNSVHFSPITTKIDVNDYIGDPYLYANFSWIWSGGECPANRWLRLWPFVVSLFGAFA